MHHSLLFVAGLQPRGKFWVSAGPMDIRTDGVVGTAWMTVNVIVVAVVVVVIITVVLVIRGNQSMGGPT